MEVITLVDLAKFVIPSVFAGGAAYGAAKSALNGTRTRVKNVETRLEQHKDKSEKQHIATVERLTRIETKLDTALTEK